MKVFGRAARNALQLSKVLASLGCWFVFFYWGFQAFQKFLARPVSSSISVKNGDDGLSNLIFPALTICTENFYVHLATLMNPNKTQTSPYCGTQQHPYVSYDFGKSLKNCVSFGKVRPTTSTTTTTTTTTTFNEYGGLGDWIYDDHEPQPEFKWVPFETVEDFMNATNLEIFDIIREFKYGSEIIVSKVTYSENERKERLKSLWIRTFDDSRGPCFTFDPFKQNVSLLSSSSDSVSNEVNRQQIFIEFSVRQISN